MIADLSKAIHQFLAPLLALASLLLILFAYISPTEMLQTQVALLTVTPTGDDGPSVFLGALGEYSSHLVIFPLVAYMRVLCRLMRAGQ